MASPATVPEWLAARRERGAALSEELELPTTRTKGWEFTDLSGLDLDGFPAIGQGEGDDSAADAVTPEAAPLQPGEEAVLELVQVDGMPLGEPAEAAGEGTPIVLPLSVAVERHPELVKAHLGSIVAGDDPFVARNDAGWTGGLFVYVPRNATLEAPVFATATQSRPGTALNWRTLIVLEEGAEAEVWEQYRSAEDDTEGLFNTVVELRVGQNAKLRFVNAQALSEKSWVFGSQRAEVDRDGAAGLGRRSASAPRAARSAWRPSSPARARARASPAPTPATAASTWTSTRRRSTRRRRRPPTSRSAACCATARPPSGAG